VAKGGAFEREICGILSLWWTDGERDDVFGRSDSSGGRFTARMKRGKSTANMAGDITFTDIDGEPLIKAWNIETKTGYGSKEKVKDSDGKIIKSIQSRWDILDYLDSAQKKTVFETMWEQCARDADKTGRVPILIFRRNLRKICVAVTCEYVRSGTRLYGPLTCRKIRFDHKEFNLYIMSVHDFLEWQHDFKITLSQQNES
jgi:hypothetical protein